MDWISILLKTFGEWVLLLGRAEHLALTGLIGSWISW
jgi:hypothetical protein